MRNHNIDEAWQLQMPPLVEAYLQWKHGFTETAGSNTRQPHKFEVTVVDIGE
jgi:hypothetical protein